MLLVEKTELCPCYLTPGAGSAVGLGMCAVGVLAGGLVQLGRMGSVVVSLG